MTDIKSVTKLFQTKLIPRLLWNAYVFVLQFNFVKAHNPGRMSTAAVFPSTLEADPNEKKVLRLREDRSFKPIGINIKSTGIAPEEPVFNTDDDLTDFLEHDIWQRKADIRNTISSQVPVITIASYYHIDVPKEASVINKEHFNKRSRILIEQDSDPTFLNFKREMSDYDLTTKY